MIKSNTCSSPKCWFELVYSDECGQMFPTSSIMEDSKSSAVAWKPPDPSFGGFTFCQTLKLKDYTLLCVLWKLCDLLSRWKRFKTSPDKLLMFTLTSKAQLLLIRGFIKKRDFCYVAGVNIFNESVCHNVVNNIFKKAIFLSLKIRKWSNGTHHSHKICSSYNTLHYKQLNKSLASTFHGSLFRKVRVIAPTRINSWPVSSFFPLWHGLNYWP